MLKQRTENIFAFLPVIKRVTLIDNQSAYADINGKCIGDVAVNKEDILWLLIESTLRLRALATLAEPFFCK